MVQFYVTQWELNVNHRLQCKSNTPSYERKLFLAMFSDEKYDSL